MPVKRADIVPLLLMPPEKVEVVLTRMAEPAETVPELLMPPKKDRNAVNPDTDIAARHRAGIADTAGGARTELSDVGDINADIAARDRAGIADAAWPN